VDKGKEGRRGLIRQIGGGEEMREGGRERGREGMRKGRSIPERIWPQKNEGR